MIKKIKHNMMVFLSKRMLSCEETGYLISRAYDKKLSFRERFRMRMHLISCNLCRRYEKQLAQLNHIVQDYKESIVLHPCQHHLEGEAKTRMSQHVNKELNQGS